MLVAAMPFWHRTALRPGNAKSRVIGWSILRR
jgi:hypothetical protein